MDKFVPAIFIVTCALVTGTHSNAQVGEYKPDKNPFGQPDILKYRAPVVAPRNKNAITVDKNNIPELKLTATLISVSEPMVIVNDKWLQVGEEIEGMRLEIIDEGRAVFNYRGKLHVFTIDNGLNTQTR